MGAIDALIAEHGRRLYGLCLTLCKNRAEADDLYQETWLKVVVHFQRYDADKPFAPWLTRICVNIYRNAFRRRIRSPVYDHFASDEEKTWLLNAAAAPEPTDYSALRAAVDRLPEKYRLTVVLFYYQDMDIQSAARVMGVPAGTVKSRLHKAKKLLKEALAHESDLSF